MNFPISAFGYGLAGLVFLVFGMLLVTGFRGRAQGGFLIAAAVASAIWGFGLAYDAVFPAETALYVFVLECSFDCAWLLFLAAMMSGAVGSSQFWLARFGGVFLAAGLLLLGSGLEAYAHYTGRGGRAADVLVTGSLLTSLYGLVMIEQIYRNARQSYRSGLKYLCLGIGGQAKALLTGSGRRKCGCNKKLQEPHGSARKTW